MKLSLVISSVFLFLALPANARILFGKEGGGGNGLHSNVQQVAQEFSQLGDVSTLLGSIRLGLQAQKNLPMEDAKARLIFSKIIDLKNIVSCHDNLTAGYCISILSQQRQLFKLKPRGACRENGMDRDAAVQFHRSPSGDAMVDEICLSAERLAVYPVHELRRQMTALIFHEYAHVAGFSEEDAVYVQKYILEKMMQPCLITLQIENRALGLEDSFKIEIFDDRHSVVNHVRKFNSLSGRTIEYTTVNKSIQLKWNLTGGHLAFESVNSDGSLSPNQVQWAFMEFRSTRDIFSTQIPSADIVFDNTPLKVSLISIDGLTCKR